MKIYTIQDRSILEKLARGEAYIPDRTANIFEKYEKSTFGSNLIKMNYFMKNNITNVSELVYGFMEVREGNIQEIQDFYDFIQTNKNLNLLKRLWNQYRKEDKVILELEVDSLEWNFMYINMADVDYLISNDKENYDSTTYSEILRTLKHGSATKGFTLSKVIQVHLPVIKPNYVKNIYEMFDLVESVGIISKDGDNKIFTLKEHYKLNNVV